MTIETTPGDDGWTRIVATDRDPIVPWRELRDRWELLAFLVWRDLKIRYKQTLLGSAWAVLQPLAAMAVFTVVFGRLARVGSEGVPYSVFAYAGLVGWIYTANAVNQASASLVDNERIISKVYFPRIVLPATPVIAGLLDLAVSACVLVALTIGHGIGIGPRLLVAPLFVALGSATALGVGLTLASLNVRYRDVRYVVPFLVQVWMFASPVVYPSQLVPRQWRPVYALNPVATVIDGLRWSALGTPAPGGSQVLASVLAAVAVLAMGLTIFRRAERTFADVI